MDNTIYTRVKVCAGYPIKLEIDVDDIVKQREELLKKNVTYGSMRIKIILPKVVTILGLPVEYEMQEMIKEDVK